MELPDELVLAVLSHIDPLRDTAAVTATCRRWRRFMFDPHLWRQFHLRVFPTRWQPPLDEDHATDATLGPVVSPAGGVQSWRLSFVAKASRLKQALNDDKARSDYEGLEWDLVAAANAGCLPLVRRYAADLSDLLVRRGLGAESLATLTCHNHHPVHWKRVEGNLLHVALCGACAAHSAPTAKALLELGAQVKSPVSTGGPRQKSPLVDAAASHNVEFAAMLLDHGADPNGDDPLLAAAREGDMAMIEMLLRRRARPDGSAIIAAAQGGHTDAVKLLFDGGCNLKHVYNALEVAVRNGHVDTARLLIDHGAVPDIAHVALALRDAKRPSMELLRLLASGINPSCSYDLLSGSPVVAAGNEEVCRFLVEHGVNINVLNEAPFRMVETPLHCAVRNKNVAHVRCLLACGAATDIKDEETKVTALSMARQFGLTEIAQLIVKHRAAAKQKKSENDSKKNEAKKRKSPEPKSEDSEESEDEEEDAQPANRKKAKKTTVTTKAKKEKVKEVSSEKQEELALEADVRRLAKLDKTDMFSLRQLLRKSACMKPSEMPKRKMEMLRAAMEWLTNGNAHPSLTDQ